MPDPRAPHSSLFATAWARLTEENANPIAFEIINKAKHVAFNKTYPFEIQPENVPSSADVLAAIEAMTDAQKSTLRRLLGLPPARSPHIYIPDGKGGFTPPSAPTT